MLTKTTTIDEKKIYDEIIASLDKTYSLCWVDYRDDVPPTFIQRCLDEKDDSPLFEENLYSEARQYYARKEAEAALERIVKDEDERELFMSTDLFYEIIYEIESRDDSTPEKDALKNTITNGYIRLHSNYDCWLPIWEQGGIQAEGTALGGIMAALSLNPHKVKEAAARREITVIGRFRNIVSREGKEVVGYDDFINVLCECGNYGNWAFFGRFDFNDMLTANFDTDSLVIPKGTTCGMFNWWNGAGSLDFCRTIRPLPVSELKRRQARWKDDVKVIVDSRDNKDKSGYVPSEVYGGTISSDTLLSVS